MELISTLSPGAVETLANISTLYHYTSFNNFLLPLNDTLHNEYSHNVSNSTMLRDNSVMDGVIIPLIYIVVCIIGLGGNTLVIHIVLHYSKTESVTNIYILNLAIADELFMLGLPFLAIQNALQTWPFGSFMCRLVLTVDGINQFTSIFCLTVMSIDRYLAVVHPIRSSKWRRPQVAKVVNGTVWAVSFIVVLPVVIYAEVHKNGSCNIFWPEPTKVWEAAFIIYTSTVEFFFPLLVICLCYLLIVIKIRSSGKKVHATSTKRRKSERRVTWMVVIVVAVFVFCWLPFYALNIINLIVPPPEDLQGLYSFVVVLSYANSCANPIVYGFLSDNFKQGFRKALCRPSRKVESHEQTEQQEERRRVLKPRDSLRRVIQGDDEEEEEEEDAEVATEITEICRITQNGNGTGQPEGSRAIFGERAKVEGTSEVVTPNHKVKTRESSGKGPGSGLVTSIQPTLNCAKNGSVRPLPEEPVESNASLKISYL